jgi:hypothetical protein
MPRDLALQLALFKQHQSMWCVPRSRRRPDNLLSTAYCRWLDTNDRQRWEAMQRQGFKCWECGYVLNPRWVHLHHPNGYANLGCEEASDIAAVHGDCHRRIHDRIKDAMERQHQRNACGCNIA